MKKFTSLLITLCILMSLPISACAQEMSTQAPADSAYAVVLDAEGNVIETLDVEVSVEQVQSPRSTGTTYTTTYVARSNSKTDSGSATKDAVIAKGMITWIDTFGPDNVLVSVEGSWVASNRTLQNKTIKYGARNLALEEIGDPFIVEDYQGDTFHIPQNYVTGYQFYLQTTAYIKETGHTIAINFNTTITATN